MGCVRTRAYNLAMEPKPLQVLLIEDDADDVALITHYLTDPRDGGEFVVRPAERLEAGAKLLAQEPFDVVLLDMVLPGVSGIEAFVKVREVRPDVPVVVLTGMRDEQLALRAVQMGAQDYLVKGTIDARVLTRAVRYAIERARLLAKVEYLLAKDLDGKVVVDHEGSVRYVNPAAEALLGRKSRELLGRPFSHPLPDAEAAQVDVVLSRDPERLGEIRVAEIEWNGQPALLATVRDVTEIKRVEQLKAEIKERMLVVDLKNEFMTTISHELRNPLTTVKTAVQSLREGLVGPMTPQQMRFVELAHRNVERQIKIINNVLDLARFQSGKVKLELRRVALPPLLEERAQAYAISQKGPHIEWHVPEDLPDVWADGDLVTQVVSNLLDNALRFARAHVCVRAAAQERGVLITVVDDGPGMSEGQISKLFTKFVQVGRPTGAGYKGTGLGLAICKEIVTGHGGKIWAESVLGKGARFNVLLPQAPRTREESHAARDQAGSRR